jgi:hypothetical protein
MAKPDETVPPPAHSERDWTRLEDYLDLGRLWRRAAGRRRNRMHPRTEPSAPGLLSLGMLPFLLLMVALGMLAVLIIIVAVPGKRAPAPTKAPSPVVVEPSGIVIR